MPTASQTRSWNCQSWAQLSVCSFCAILSRIVLRPFCSFTRPTYWSLLVRTTVTGDERAVGRPFGAAIVELALANVPGFYGLTLPGPPSTFGTYWPAVIEQSAVPHRVTLPDGTTEPIPAPPAPPESPAPRFSCVSTDEFVSETSGEPVGGVRGALGLVADMMSRMLNNQEKILSKLKEMQQIEIDRSLNKEKPNSR